MFNLILRDPLIPHRQKINAATLREISIALDKQTASSR